MNDWGKLSGPGAAFLRKDPLPVGAVRDLLGLSRAIYVARREAGAPEAELAQLAMVGRRLRHALLLASHAANPVHLTAAWWQAEQATRELGLAIEHLGGAEPIVRAAAGRVRRRR